VCPAPGQTVLGVDVPSRSASSESTTGTTTLPVPSRLTFPSDVQTVESKASTVDFSNRWSVLDSVGLTLRNSRNNCWFHSTLYLLTGVPSIRLSAWHFRWILELLKINYLKLSMLSLRPATSLLSPLFSRP
jgi:hypothetical protein